MENTSTLYFLLISTLLLAVTFVKRKFSYWKRMGVPFEQPIFPFGNVYGVGDKYHLSDITLRLYNQLKVHNTPFIGFYSFMRPVVLVTDFEFAKRVFLKDSAYFLDRGNFYNEEDDPLSAHLFAVDNPKWKALRSKLTPTFTSGKMKMMFATVRDVAEKLNTTLAEEASVAAENALEIKDILGRFTTDVIGSVAFGLECNSLENPICDFRSKTRKVFEEPRHSQVVFAILSTFKDLAKKLHIKVIRDDTSEFFLNVVKETVKYREETSLVRNDFMHLLIQLKNEKDAMKGSNNLTVEEIAAQAFIFFLAGFETSSAAMSFVLFELSRNQTIQDMAREEIRKVLKDHNDEFTYEALSDMNYLEGCIYEALRKYPALGNITRDCGKDYHVENTNFIIKKGQQIFIPVRAFHYDPDLYSDPQRFDPDRFKTKEQRGSYKFMTFGQGPRNCIGLRFGVMQAKIGLALLLKKFKFEPCSKSKELIEVASDLVVTQPKGGVHLKVTEILN